MSIATINPATGETLRTFIPLTDQELEAAVARAHEGFLRYRHTSLPERAAWLARAADILESEQDRFGRIMVTEMGKPLNAARQEAAKCALACRYYAENGARLLADHEVKTEATRSLVRCQPLGPVLAIMPWNFPFWQVFRFAAPALMAGNVGLLKHASNVPQCALAIEEILRRAGFPDDAFQTLLIGPEKVESLLADPRIAAATLTGSTGAGSAVASAAGKHIKKTVLELGGSDPFVVLPSARLDIAARTAAQARTVNNGQSCIAAKRFVVDDSIADDFVGRLVKEMESLQVGDPMDEATQIGPLATAAQRNTVAEQVRRTVEAGARVLTGGKPLDRPGWYYPPTVLADIPPGSPGATEEVFGPVALVFRVSGIDEAIAVANDTPFGLGASAWTEDPEEQARLVNELDAGMVFINGMVASDPRLPFGGVKRSGYGRELGEVGIYEFVNRKTIWIRAAAAPGAAHRTATE
ncbi:MAG TPA: NAD-dependent succinate-semialdehyde dehydrogenase [Gemmatimonadales bacterium]|nr:NAD-dependent succinate-semialdehyde dehydrogenase [Gemmatimonadales bacterium]